MVYMIQVIIYTALMCLVYIVLLRNRQMHSFNRSYLLATVVLPLVLPFIRFSETFGEQVRTTTALNVRLPEFVLGATAQKAAITMSGILWIGYIAGAAILLSVTVYRWVAIASVARKHPQLQQDDHILIPNSGFGPGSWHKYIFLPNEEQNEAVIRHELAHIRLQHTKDLVLLNLAQAFFWPNLLLVWIRKELVQVHEFQADAATGMETRAYAELLLSNIFGRCMLPSTHSFIVHPIKRRISMLKRKSSKMQRYTSGIIAIIAAGVLLTTGLGIQSCKRKNFNVETAQTNKTPGGVAMNSTEGVTMPQFNGDMVAYLSSHIKYPKEAMDKKIEGKVLVEFAIDEHGKIKDAHVKSSPDEVLSQSALEVVNSMPDWVPGEKNGEKVCMAYTLPVLYRLN